MTVSLLGWSPELNQFKGCQGSRNCQDQWIAAYFKVVRSLLIYFCLLLKLIETMALAILDGLWSK